MKTAALLFLLHMAGGLPGRLVYGDIPSFPIGAILSLGTVVAVGAVVVLIIIGVVLVIRKTKITNAKKGNPDHK